MVPKQTNHLLTSSKAKSKHYRCKVIRMSSLHPSYQEPYYKEEEEDLVFCEYLKTSISREEAERIELEYGVEFVSRKHLDEYLNTLNGNL